MNSDDNVVIRLRRRLEEAKVAGFKVRFELLNDEQAGWCQIGSSKFLIVNSSHTAAEQLAEVEVTLRDFAASAVRSDEDRRATAANQAA